MLPRKKKRTNEASGSLTGIVDETKASDFLLKQYESLPKEIELLIQESRSLERNIVFLVGVSWGWLYTAKVQMRHQSGRRGLET